MKSGGSSNEPPEVSLSDDATDRSRFVGVDGDGLVSVEV
jgi:hypothetical protein